MKRDHDAIRAELERLKVGGVIRPVDVVEAARDESSPLHPCFQWDDGEAAHQYRLLQARNLLRVYVNVEPAANVEPVRAYVSLTSDRVKDGGGYRAMAEVLSDSDLRQQLLNDAFVQFRNMRKKYEHLKQLSKVWAAIDEAEKQAQAEFADAA